MSILIAANVTAGRPMVNVDLSREALLEEVLETPGVYAHSRTSFNEKCGRHEEQNQVTSILVDQASGDGANYDNLLANGEEHRHCGLLIKRPCESVSRGPPPAPASFALAWPSQSHSECRSASRAYREQSSAAIHSMQLPGDVARY